MNAQTAPAPEPAAAPQTPPLPEARPETLGLSQVRLARASDALKREVDKGTIPGVTFMVARRGQIGWFAALIWAATALRHPIEYRIVHDERVRGGKYC